jgi:hypothetical protein
LDGDDAAFANVTVIGKIRFFNDARLSGENNVQILVPRLIDSVWSCAGFFGLDADRRGDFFIGL